MVPFFPAEWGTEYTLAGAVWKPTGRLHCQDKTQLEVMIQNGRVCWACDLTRPQPTERATQFRAHTHALLPSPAWINAQSDPRAVAIAALERAGFERGTSRLELELTSDDNATLALLMEPEHYPGVYVDTHDPALARYAVDCFAVLHQWASEVKWDRP